MGDHIFISYSREDLAIVDKIVAILQRSNISVWRDHEEIPVSSPNWKRLIRQGIITARGVIYVASEDAAASENVDNELLIARDNDIPIYPLWIAGTKWSDCVPFGYSTFQYADGRSNIDGGIEAIIVQIGITPPQKEPVVNGFDVSKIFEDMEERRQRFPFYLLLDCSKSMEGRPLAEIDEGVSLMISAMQRTPYRQQDQTHVSVITFADTATRYPGNFLMQLRDFSFPPLSAGGLCRAGTALQLLAGAIEHDLVHSTRAIEYDHSPIVFLFSGGKFSDDVEAPVRRLRSLPDNLLPAAIKVFAVGEGADVEALRKIVGSAFRMSDVTPDLMGDILRRSIDRVYDAVEDRSGRAR